jgi:hypothetical protein
MNTLKTIGQMLMAFHKYRTTDAIKALKSIAANGSGSGAGRDLKSVFVGSRRAGKS